MVLMLDGTTHIDLPKTVNTNMLNVSRLMQGQPLAIISDLEQARQNNLRGERKQIN